jgi:hypothetical protein
MAPIYFPNAYAPDGCGFAGGAPGFAAPCYAGHALVGYAYYPTGAPAPYAGAHGPYVVPAFPPQHMVGHLVPPGAGAVPGHAAVRPMHGRAILRPAFRAVHALQGSEPGANGDRAAGARAGR